MTTGVQYGFAACYSRGVGAERGVGGLASDAAAVATSIFYNHSARHGGRIGASGQVQSITGDRTCIAAIVYDGCPTRQGVGIRAETATILEFVVEAPVADPDHARCGVQIHDPGVGFITRARHGSGANCNFYPKLPLQMDR